MFTTVTVPIWALLLASLACGLALQKLGWMLAKWMLRDGPWSEQPCPICLRPHDSEARRLQRQLEKMHENYARLSAEHEALKRLFATNPKTGEPEIQIRTSVVGGGAPIVNSGYDYIRLVVDHDAVAPDGTRSRIPAGTRMYMPTSGVGDGYEQNCGVAAHLPGEDATDLRDGDAS